MPYALVPMVANTSPGPRGIIGTHPLSLDFGGNAVVLSDTLAIAWTPSDIPDVRVQTICDDRLDLLVANRRAILQNLLPDRTIDPATRFNDIVGDLLKTPPNGAGWRSLLPNVRRGQREILLGPGNYLGQGFHHPGLLWSEAADIGGPHSQTLTDTFNRANAAISGSTSSDGLFTWSLGYGTSALINVTSNQAVVTRSGSDHDMAAIASVAMDTADAYSWTDSLTLTGSKEYAGPFLRSTNIALFGAGDTGYLCQLDVGFSNLFTVYRNDTGAVIDSVATGGITTGGLYLEFVGSTYLVSRSGVTLLSGTNTVHAGGVGQRKVGWTAGVYTSNSNSVSMDTFFAGDIPPVIAYSFAGFPKAIVQPIVPQENPIYVVA